MTKRNVIDCVFENRSIASAALPDIALGFATGVALALQFQSVLQIHCALVILPGLPPKGSSYDGPRGPTRHGRQYGQSRFLAPVVPASPMPFGHPPDASETFAQRMMLACEGEPASAR